MTAMSPEKVMMILEAALMVAGEPLTALALQKLFNEEDQPSVAEIKILLAEWAEQNQNRGFELCEVASGYRLQAKAELSPWLSKLWEERAPRYSRAFLETLVLIAYRQPITRAEIEEIRGVTISSHIMKSLLEREWIRVIGYREVPGKPAIYATTKEFLDYFNLKSLAELPSLAEFKDLQTQEARLQVELALENSGVGTISHEALPEENTVEQVDAKTPSELIEEEQTHQETPLAEEHSTMIDQEVIAE